MTPLDFLPGIMASCAEELSNDEELEEYLPEKIIVIT